jgi:hypothetical protein
MNTILQSYLEKGLLYNQVHPTLDLTIWNYTENVQYQGLWDEITLMCRGLVTNSDGKIIYTRYIGEQHVKEDCNNFIPSAKDWIVALEKNERPIWMMKTMKIKLED